MPITAIPATPITACFMWSFATRADLRVGGELKLKLARAVRAADAVIVELESAVEPARLARAERERQQRTAARAPLPPLADARPTTELHLPVLLDAQNEQWRRRRQTAPPPEYQPPGQQMRVSKIDVWLRVVCGRVDNCVCFRIIATKCER